jgi:hypothetical protein
VSDEWDEYRRSKAREWLHEVRHTISAMRALQNDLRAEKESYDMMKGIAYDSDGRGSGMLHGDDSIASHIGRIADAVQKLTTLDVEYSDKVREARETLNKLTCHPCATEIMTDHYLVGWSWEKVASETGYSFKRIEQIYPVATLECYSLMPIEYREQLPRADD